MCGGGRVCLRERNCSIHGKFFLVEKWLQECSSILPFPSHLLESLPRCTHLCPWVFLGFLAGPKQGGIRLLPEIVFLLIPFSGIIVFFMSPGGLLEILQRHLDCQLLRGGRCHHPYPASPPVCHSRSDWLHGNPCFPVGRRSPRGTGHIPSPPPKTAGLVTAAATRRVTDPVCLVGWTWASRSQGILPQFGVRPGALTLAFSFQCHQP